VYRRAPSAELVSAAHHEAGHAVAIVLAFSDAAWLPKPPPPLPVRYVEITQDAAGQWGGSCVGKNIYSTRWPARCIAPRYRPLMERQILVELSGGIAESIYRGEAQMTVATRRAMDADLGKALALLDGDLYRLTGHRAALTPFIDRTRALLTEHWDAVDALASALVEHRRIEGDEVEAIIRIFRPSGEQVRVGSW
jgi:hypothetical protein